jgi:tetratricopeptide (TPR) repeat protein
MVHKKKQITVSKLEGKPPSRPASPSPSTQKSNEIIQGEIKNKNLCLNMIVKNESKIITRLLKSAVPYIDCYCICDTGSTDNTVQVIQEFFASQNPPIPGKIIQEPFKDFGYNRTFALKACESLDVKYVILLDADMILQVNPHISPSDLYTALSKDVYYIFQGSETFFYKNVRVVKNKLGMSYWGVTHEYVKTPEGSVYGTLERKDIFINDIGDGGCKADKFIRDIRLLKKGLEELPNNDRYTFYLANSYRDAGQYDNAIETYKKRIEIGGWFDEVWHSYYSIGKCYKYKGDMASAIYWWLEGYNFYPHRIENLFEIIHHYRVTGKNQIAYGIYAMADHERRTNKNTDYLFYQKDISDYKLDYELTIIGYYCNYNNYDLVKKSMHVLNYPHVEDSISKNTLSNFKFYVRSLKEHEKELNPMNYQLLKNIGRDIPEIQEALAGDFVPSTPTMVFNSEGNLVVNVRFVNYKITENGGYTNPGTIATKNVVAIIDCSPEEWQIQKTYVLDYNKEHDGLYVGLEDVRLFAFDDHPSDNKIYFNANRGLGEHKIQVEHGFIDEATDATVSGLVSMHGQHEVEKNWVLFEGKDNAMKAIYGWNPLRIGDIEQDKKAVITSGLPPMEFKLTHSHNTPRIFKMLRGSTNGVVVDDEVWFICHAVSYEDRRYYYHMFVVLDKNTYVLKRYSDLFTFNKEKVEYTLGFIYSESDDTKEFLIGYSVMDRETDYMLIDKEKVDAMMNLP